MSARSLSNSLKKLRWLLHSFPKSFAVFEMYRSIFGVYLCLCREKIAEASLSQKVMCEESDQHRLI